MSYFRPRRFGALLLLGLGLSVGWLLASASNSRQAPLAPPEPSLGRSSLPEATSTIIAQAEAAPDALPSPTNSIQALSLSSALPACLNTGHALQRAQVVRIIDGDTIEVVLDGELDKVRYIGINTPEMNEPHGDLARAFNAEMAAGQEAILVRDQSQRDAFGRLLRYVIVGERFVNWELVRAGMGCARDYGRDTACSLALNEAQNLAKGAGGLACQESIRTPSGEKSAWWGALILQPTCTQVDAPGDDGQNLNEEYVCLENITPEPLELAGWQLNDESGKRYVFQHLRLLPGGRVTLHSGSGTDSAQHLYWGRSGSAVWNNSGDTLFLYDAEGHLVLSESIQP